MTVLQMCGVALSVLMFALQTGKKSRAAVFAASLLFFAVSLDGIEELFSLVGQQQADWQQQGFTSLLKELGIGVVCQFTAELCKDAGEKTLAARVEFFAKVQIVLLSFPLLQELLALAREFVQ